jgi:hypothetical protein
VKFVPINRHLLVEPVHQSEEEAKILLPEDYKPKEPFAIVKLLTASAEVQILVGILIILRWKQISCECQYA